MRPRPYSIGCRSTVFNGCGCFSGRDVSVDGCSSMRKYRIIRLIPWGGFLGLMTAPAWAQTVAGLAIDQRVHPLSIVAIAVVAIALTTISRDTARQKQAESQRGDSEEGHRALVQYAPGRARIIACEGIIAYANQAVSWITGWSAAELIGTSIYQKLHPDDAGANEAAIRSIANQPGGTAHGDSRVKTKHGSWRGVGG